MTKGLLVFQSDFGNSDGAVSAMHGVANSVKLGIPIFEVTHQIPQYNLWEASYRLLQAIGYWPEETVFVSIVDPGVGSDRRAVVAKTVNNHYIVTPDNGTLTHVNASIGITEIREIDESINRLPNSGESHTFHGRDIFAYTAARLAADVIQFEEVGPSFNTDEIISLPLKNATIENEIISGNIDIIDRPFGNLWTNISRELFRKIAKQHGDSFEVTIITDGRTIYNNIMTYGRSFADLHIGEPLVYVNSLDNIGIAINQGSFADAYRIGTGTNWEVFIRKAPRIIYE
ncbi:S-adenosyl-l-methionine hydroxide adenosyltransferase family protein [Sporosarcina pasteurii]|uniref:S-adenosyl-l-methionine hydroxide adenosyltransferase n=1 Tax=Sporosarcina pasteurii TaxID=1474 RepID=A0A380C8I3_SPOPA|nr:S-adenosyl-l-methionine hydroxide adenosyltransferase family protein [Sporosarcina pasteurii]MDS9471810.1 S-adenosyl-l-methionine hydroxide adenosyltransferase family protein [Sporosarcina pasteurii]QBQ04598.1 DNA-directed RNA polymerase subunit delta [Sporosarcina pasteurii]SUJ13938.1 S-adenosyl-l-methionine hydroxide adenosyltransferase [Sporosarcina pasteurii]